MREQRIRDAIAQIADGQPVIVIDDDDRENEGDLVMAAAKATPKWTAFMIRHTSGILCAPLEQAEARRLRLDPMVAANDAPLGTAFTVSVDLRAGLTTGISADERCNTVRALADPKIGPDDFVRPGHVFPLIAKAGGVLMRSGHTEAAVDLARLAGLPPVGLISELVNDDGTVMRGPEIQKFAEHHNLIVVSIDELISYRQRDERLIARVAEFPVETEIGTLTGFAFASPFDQLQHLALVYGDPEPDTAVAVRLQMENVLTDVFGSRPAIQRSLKIFKKEQAGVLVYLRDGAAGVASTGLRPATDEENTASAVTRAQQWRDIGVGAQILRDIGIRRIKLIATEDRQYVGLDGFGLSIDGTLPLEE